jgi:hypothetical protein
VEEPKEEVAGRAASPGVRLVTVVLVAVLGVALIVWAWRADPEFYERHMTVLSCFTEYDHREVHGLVVKRVLAVALGAGAILASVPFGGFVARHVSPGALVRCAAGAVLAVPASDLLLRALHFPADERPTVLTRLDDRYGWSLVASSTIYHGYGSRVVGYAVDAGGHRSMSQDDAPNLAQPTILVAGESVGMGVGLPYEESFAYLLGKRLDLQVVNASVHTYASDQIYLRSMDELARLEHPVALVTLVMAHTIQRVTRAWTSHLTLEPDGSFGLAPAAPPFWQTSPLRALALDAFPYHDDERVRVTRAVLAETARRARDQGAFPLFVWTNYRMACLRDGRGTSPLYRAVFDGLGVANIQVDIPWSEKLVDDEHPSAAGQERLEGAIEGALRDAGIGGAFTSLHP